MTPVDRLHQLLEALPESEWYAAERFLQFLRHESERREPQREPDARLAVRVRAVKGKYAGVGSSVDEFCCRKQAEIDRSI